MNQDVGVGLFFGGENFPAVMTMKDSGREPRRRVLLVCSLAGTACRRSQLSSDHLA